MNEPVAGEAEGSGPSTGEPTVAAPAAAETEEHLVSIEEFGRIELRVAVILAAERIVGTDRLLKLDIDLGEERRQIVSGIAHVYEPEALVGRRIVVVANLQPARIRGVESRGMLLAAGGRTPGQTLALLSVDAEIPPGTRVS